MLELVQTGPVRVSLQLQSGSCQHESLPLADLKISSRLGSTPREISLPNGGLFVTQDNDGVDQLLRQGGGLGFAALVHRLESQLLHFAPALLLSLLLVVAGVVYGIPAAAKWMAFNVPEIAAASLDQGLGMMDQALFEPSELPQARQDEIREFLAPYLASHQSLNPRLQFRSGMGANAFALPGGDIVLTDDFVSLAEHNEEILAVFFHELGHLKHRHALRRVIQGSILTLAVVFITGDLDTIDLVTGLPTLLVDLSYSRDFEVEADTYALEQMQQAQIPLQHFAAIMARLQSQDTDKAQCDSQDNLCLSDFLSTHPPTPARVALANRMLEQQAASEGAP